MRREKIKFDTLRKKKKIFVLCKNRKLNLNMLCDRGTGPNVDHGVFSLLKNVFF